MSTYFQPDEIIYVVIDRTAWGRINLFVISIVWDKRAFPIYFDLLSKLGSSNIDEQKTLISQVLPLFKGYKICVLGDREFCSIKLATWIRDQGLSFCLRLKKNEFIEVQHNIWKELNDLGLCPGISLFLQGVRVTKQKGFSHFNVAGKWKRKIQVMAPKEGWFLVTNLVTLSVAIAAYKRRFDIEEMFRDFKSGGYNLEDTKVSNKRLISLILLIAIRLKPLGASPIAYTSATIHGQQIKQKGVQKYVGRIKEYGRIERRHSSFYIGLYGESSPEGGFPSAPLLANPKGQTWVNFMEVCEDLVTELMRLCRNKSKYYQRGLRAMKLILSAS
ncbi:hypothetical protein NUACC26_067460 [Scytonema sp. NUACC26]